MLKRRITEFAYHEAGHAVMALSLGYTVVARAVSADGGHCHSTCDDGSDENELMICLAGLVAEYMHSKAKWTPKRFLSAAPDDAYAAYELVSDMYDLDDAVADELFVETIKHVEAILASRWDVVESLVERLLVNQVITDIAA